jgi:citrate synthase
MGDAQVAFSKGLEGVVAAQTALSLVDGEAGRLFYRGIEIHELVRHSTFEEVTYFLFYGELPKRDALARFLKDLAGARLLPEGLIKWLQLVPRRSHPMAVLRTFVSALSFYDRNPENLAPEANLRRSVRLVGVMPTLMAAFHRLRRGKKPLEPRKGFSHAANFLYMLHGKEPDPDHAKTLDAYLILLADHGLNASTFAARVTVATLSDMYSAITSAIGTLKGDLHGSANQRAMEMFLEIGEVEKAEAHVTGLLAQHKRVMGFGHRVYRTEDPRAKEFRVFGERICKGTRFGKWLRISQKVEEVVWRDKKIPVNVDFYSASVLYALGIPTDLFTAVFAMSRVAGWTAHVIEQLHDNRLIRPKAEYTGPMNQTYVPIENR